MARWPNSKFAAYTTPPSGAVDPLTLLPQPVFGDIRNANGFPGKSWALNTPWTDTTGVKMTRLTNASTCPSNLSNALEYSAEGPVISQPISDGAGGFYYWVGFNTSFVGKVHLSSMSGVVTMDQTTVYQLPNVTGANIGHCFSQLPGEQTIMYIGDTAGHIRRYDVAAKAYAPNSVFVGASAEFSLGAGYGFPGQMTVSWDGTRLGFSAGPGIGNKATAIMRLMTQTGALASYTGGPNSEIFCTGTCTGATTTSMTDTSKNWPTGNINGGPWFAGALTWTSGVNNGLQVIITGSNTNSVTFGAMATASSPGDTYVLTCPHQVHMCRGNVDAMVITTASTAQNQGSVWFPANGNKASQQWGDTFNTSAGHGDCFADFFVCENPTIGGSIFYTMGTPVTNDGDPYNGTATSRYNVTSPSPWGQIKNVDGHKSGNWNRTGMAPYAMGDSYQLGYPGAGANAAVDAIAAWTLVSGNIYSAPISGSASSTVGVNEVLIWNGVTNAAGFGSGSIVSGHLTPAASLAAMTAGSFFYNLATRTLYCWMPDGASPLNRVVPNCLYSLAASIHFYKEDGTDTRRLCWIYTEPTNDVYTGGGGNYTRLAYTQISPDGRIVISTMNLLQNDGRTDLVGIVVPVSASAAPVLDGYPLLAALSNGGDAAYSGGTATAGVAWNTMASKRHFVIGQAFPGNPGNWAAVCQACAQAGLLAVPPRLVSYIDLCDIDTGTLNVTSSWYPLAHHIDLNKWWLWSGPNLSGSIEYFKNSSLTGSYQMNTTNFPAVDSNGKTWQQFAAGFAAGFMVNGVGQPANPNNAGALVDNIFALAQTAGYYNLTTNGSVNTEPYPNQDVRTGLATFLVELRKAFPAGAWILGNAGPLAFPGHSSNGYAGIMDGILFEIAIGNTTSSQEMGGWNVLLGEIQGLQALLTGRPNGGVIIEHDSITITTGQDLVSTARGDPAWQAVRYGPGVAMVLGCYYANVQLNSPTVVGTDCAAQFELDFMDCAGTRHREYLGQPLPTAQGAIQTAAWQTFNVGGKIVQVLRRDFQNGIALLRPPTNANPTVADTNPVTITAAMLGNITYHLFQGVQDATYNGTAVTSWTFQRDRDAIILLNSP